MTKKPSLKLAKKKAWKFFSEYIRRKYAGEGGLVKCVTCSKIDHWKRMQAGHYIDGRNNTVLFDERLVWPQCFHCNSKMGGCLAGNKIQFTKFLLKQGYTIEQLIEFDDLKFKTKNMTIFDYQYIEHKYKSFLEGINEETKKEE